MAARSSACSLRIVMTASRRQVPPSADVVVIGGGVIGLSTAYHQLRQGSLDLIVLDKDALGSGSTSKAAGAIWAHFSVPVNVTLGARRLETFRNLSSLFGLEIHLHQ